MAIHHVELRNILLNLSLDGAQKSGSALGDGLERQADHCLRGDFIPGGAEVGTQGGFHGGDGELVYTQGAEQRMATNFGDEVFSSGDDAGLWTAEKLVSAEEDKRETRLNTVAHGWFVNASGGKVDQAAGTKIFDDGQSTASAESDQFRDIGFFGKASYGEIRGMNAKKYASVFVNGVFVVGDSRAIGSANFTKPRATLLHDFGDAKTITDFDQLAARNDHFTSASQSRQREENRGGAIIDGDGGFSISQTLEQAREMYVAFAAGAGREGVFQVGILGSGFAKFVDCRGNQWSSTEIGVKDYAGSVDDRAKRGSEFGVDSIDDALLEVLRGQGAFVGEFSRGDFAAQLSQNVANGGNGISAFDGTAKSSDSGTQQQLVNGGKTAKQGGVVWRRSRLGGSRHGVISPQAQRPRNCEGGGAKPRRSKSDSSPQATNGKTVLCCAQDDGFSYCAGGRDR